MKKLIGTPGLTPPLRKRGAGSVRADADLGAKQPPDKTAVEPQKPAPLTSAELAAQQEHLVNQSAASIETAGNTHVHLKNQNAHLETTATAGGTRLSETSPLLARFGARTLAQTLDARGRAAFTSAALDDAVVNVFAPLSELLESKPDGTRWNAATWAAFQAGAGLPLGELEATAAALAQGRPLPPAARGLKTALSASGVNVETLTLLLNARALSTKLVQQELPSLTPSERNGYVALVHDEGYAKAQQARTRSPASILCPLSGPGVLLDDQRLTLLPPAVQARFALSTRATQQGEDSLPRVTLADFLNPLHESQGGAADNASVRVRTFLVLSGKDPEGLSELGMPLDAFMKRGPSESPQQFRSRLASKQLINPFTLSWEDLQKDAAALGAAGGNEGGQRTFIEGKQHAALAPSLLVLCAPSLFAPAFRGASDEMAANLDGLMQVCWRVANPNLPFSDPVVGKGRAELVKTHKEQLDKDRHLWSSVINAAKTRLLSGLRDENYDARTAAFLTARGLATPSDEVNQASERLVRDVGGGNPHLGRLLAGIDLAGDPHVVRDQLHQLRHDPRVYALDVPPGSGPLCFGGLRLRMPQSGTLLPEMVSATTVGFRMTLDAPVQGFAAGESVLVRVPKGARPRIENGALTFDIYDQQRLDEVQARLGDFQVMGKGIGLTPRALVKSGGLSLLVEKRSSLTAAAQLTNGSQISAQDVATLADLYVQGLSERSDAGRAHGVFYELGPDNYVLDKKGIVGSYVDVALMFRTERDRDAFGFFNGGYGSAVNWIVGDNTPLSAEAVASVWRSEDLTPAELVRRNLFASALRQRLDPRHPVYARVSAEVRTQIIASLQQDAQVLEPPAKPDTNTPADAQNRLVQNLVPTRRLQQAAIAADGLNMGGARAAAFANTILPLLAQDAERCFAVSGLADDIVRLGSSAALNAGIEGKGLYQDGEPDLKYPQRAAASMLEPGPLSDRLGISAADLADADRAIATIAGLKIPASSHGPSAFQLATLDPALTRSLQRVAALFATGTPAFVDLSGHEKALALQVFMANLTWHMTNFQRAATDPSRREVNQRQGTFNLYTTNLAQKFLAYGNKGALEMLAIDAFQYGRWRPIPRDVVG